MKLTEARKLKAGDRVLWRPGPNAPEGEGHTASRGTVEHVEPDLQLRFKWDDGVVCYMAFTENTSDWWHQVTKVRT